MLDLAFTFPRFAVAASDARMRSLDVRNFLADREVYAALADIFDRVAVTPREGLSAIYDELNAGGGGCLAHAMAADAIDQALDELEGREHVPN